MLTDAVESRNLLPWLLDRINPNEMVLRIGPGKNIAVTPSVISMVLGIPHGGRNIKLYTTDEGRQFKKDLIKDLGQECLHDGDDIHISNLQEEILKGNVDELFFRCFFMIVFNRFLFSTTTYKFDYSDITKSKHPEDFGHIDWSQEVFNNLQFAIRRCHFREKTQRTQTVYGCSIFLIVLYLDHLHHTRSPADWLSTPRIRFYNKATIEGLTIVDRIIHEDGSEEYGLLPVSSRALLALAMQLLLLTHGVILHISINSKYLKFNSPACVICCHGHLSCLYDESIERETQETGFMLAESVNLIKQCLPDKCDLQKAKMIFLPILVCRRWSVYCVNIGHRRIDVLDSQDYCQSTTPWRDYHDPLAKSIIPALSDALSFAAPRQFPYIKNWRRAPVQLAYHKNSNDSGLFALRFLEYYDGEGHGSLKTTIDPVRAKDTRADILYYLCFHTNNAISQIPDDVIKFREA